MAAFTLDTSGRVAGDVGGLAVWYEFEDLDAFTQGYVEALLRDFFEPSLPNISNKGFSDLSSEALAMILADCAAYVASCHFVPDASWGSEFWPARQRGGMPVLFPPLTVSLGDDGRVSLTPTLAKPQVSEKI